MLNFQTKLKTLSLVSETRKQTENGLESFNVFIFNKINPTILSLLLGVKNAKQTNSKLSLFVSRHPHHHHPPSETEGGEEETFDLKGRGGVEKQTNVTLNLFASRFEPQNYTKNG